MNLILGSVVILTPYDLPLSLKYVVQALTLIARTPIVVVGWIVMEHAVFPLKSVVRIRSEAITVRTSAVLIVIRQKTVLSLIVKTRLPGVSAIIR